VHDSGDPSPVANGAGWRLHKAAACAAEDENFRRLASAHGELMLWHIRRRTVGRVGTENTHPFRSGRWVFAHNGTIHDDGYLRARVSRTRLSELRGSTDSELFFAYLLSEMDAAGLTHEAASSATDRVLRDAVGRACATPSFGAANFLLSDGTALYAHRRGRTLFLLERGPTHDARPTRRHRDGVIVVTRWSRDRRAVLIASEAMTNEPWKPIEEGSLVRVDRAPTTGAP